MATLDYAEIPSYATRLQSADPADHTIRTAPKILTALPNPDNGHSPTSADSQPSAAPAAGPSAPFSMTIPNLLLSSALQFPDATTTTNTPTSAAAAATSNPRRVYSNTPVPLLTTRELLSITTTTINFKRFVAKSGPAFWFLDRVEEVVMWRKGWKVTGVWMAGYAFLCYFPRLILLLPHTILLAIILSTHPSTSLSPPTANSQPAAPTQAPPENSIAWQANMQGIQNLMGALSDLDDFIHPYIPYIAHPHSHAPHTIFTITSTTLLLLLFLLPFIPMRAVALVVGLTPMGYTNPFVRGYVFPVLVPWVWGVVLRVLEDLSAGLRVHRLWKKEGEEGEGRRGRRWSFKSIRALAARVMDDDRLEDRHWNTEMREVELWENERWSPTGSSSSATTLSNTTTSTNTVSDSSAAINGTGGNAGAEGGASAGGGGWGKGYLRGLAERSAWTRGRDGWSGVGEDGSGEVRSVFFLLFSLPPSLPPSIHLNPNKQPTK
ncbi:hypothetical protein PILCRDRAFT_17074 [Piloderma croceum F 1598]|uniref:TECPR1-like DysF domain-containing protein n=1 Tax=Piloderma croceum (strain F 1598) TaxID=765440 RepID=A0A0C3ETM7_PILCF|nr:hypothetical protein PILCRDRAFT_17074 [Piloderma croceum F 1598]